MPSMWQYIIPAIAVIGAAVLTQTEFFDPTSRRVRRLKAYLEIKQQLSGTPHENDVDKLIAHVISTEVRARTSKRSFGESRKLGIVWVAAAFTMIGVAVYILLTSRDDMWQAMSAIVAAVVGAVLSAWIARQYREQAAAEKEDIREASLADQYARHAQSQGLTLDPRSGDRHFDLVLRDGKGRTVQVVDVLGSVNANLKMLLNKKNLAQDYAGSAKYVLLLERAPSGDTYRQVRRIGVHVAYPLKQGGFFVDGEKPSSPGGASKPPATPS